MGDKERILTEIVRELDHTMTLGRHVGFGPYTDHMGNVMAQFVSIDSRPGKLALRPGAVVMCRTGRTHEWTIGVFVRDNGGRDACGHYLLRKLGSRRLCRVSNEGLDVLIGMDPSKLLERKARRVYEWCHRAFIEGKGNPKADHWNRCGGVEVGESSVRVWIRPHAACAQRPRPDGEWLHAQPWSVDIPWNSRTRYRDIVQALLDAGFPREFEYVEAAPQRGMEGMMSISRLDLIGRMAHAGFDLCSGIGSHPGHNAESAQASVLPQSVARLPACSEWTDYRCAHPNGVCFGLGSADDVTARCPGWQNRRKEGP